MTLSLPTLSQAEDYLAKASALNPGDWVPHSHYVAQAAQAIASRHPGLNAEYAYILGLLHDIGRREGVHGLRHILDGYRFLVGEGYPDAARVCLTHAFPIPGETIAAAPWDGTEDELRFIQNYLSHLAYDDYDRLIQLCDCLSLPSGFCLMEKRLVDVALRYGINQHTLRRWLSFFAVKREIEQAIGVSVYRLLPGVIDTTFDWTT
jgi:hypothetical protein